ncbi:hypothetical protein STEG23_022606 [Scotinomys teguina]
MGNILQRSSPEVKNLTQFSLLKGLRNYLPSQVERVLRASASLWPFDNRPWSLSPRSPISNQDAQQELDTTPKSLEYLTINKAKTDLAVQRQLPQPTPKLKCRESHGKPGKNSRGVKIPDSGSGDSRCNHTGAEETTDSQVTSDHIKELSQDKRKGSLSVEVPETMKNTLSRDSMRSAFHPVIRKRPGSSFVPRPEKEKRSLDISLLLEECVDCCALCSGLAARSSGSRAGDAKPKMRRNDAVPTGTSSSQQRGLVKSPSTQISLKPAPSTQQTFPYLQVVTINSYIYCRCSSKTDTFGKLSMDFQETEVCPDFKEEYKYVKRFSGSFSSIQDSTKNMDIPNHMKNLNPMKLFRRILDCTLRGDFTADGLDQLTLCSQSPGFGTPAAPVQGHPKSVLSCRHWWPGRLFDLPNNLALSLRCRPRFQEAPLSSEQAVLLLPSLITHSRRGSPGDFMANGLEQLTLCSSRLASVHRQHLCSQCTLCPATCIELADILDPWVVHAVDDVVQHPSDPTTTWRPNFGKAAIQLSHLYENF